jgi:hypothetical protein
MLHDPKGNDLHVTMKTYEGDTAPQIRNLGVMYVKDFGLLHAPAPLPLGEGVPITPCIGDWMSPRVRLDMKNRKYV